MSSPDKNSRICEIINSSLKTRVFIKGHTSYPTLKYTMQNPTAISLFKSSFIILLLMILISTLFYLESVNTLYIYVHDRVQHTLISYSEYNATTLNVAVVPQYATLTWKDKVNSGVSPPDSKQLCPVTPPGLVGSVSIITESNTISNTTNNFTWVDSGGRGNPSHCTSRHRVAIIIPYRNRESHLRVFLHNIHPFLHKQELDYGIYVIDQNGVSKFNRAMLMNKGFVEALKIYDYQCFIFHDVDLIPVNDNNIYNCPKQPRHMSISIDKFKYRLPYFTIFGGVSGLTKEQFKKINGFSNQFFGWGGEDDDMWNRIYKAGYKVIRYPSTIARYKMMKHGREKGNLPNDKRLRLLRDGPERFKTDGINSLKYTVNKIDYNPLFTRILVDINENEVMAATGLIVNSESQLSANKNKQKP